jgi:hypothetical protein
MDAILDFHEKILVEKLAPTHVKSGYVPGFTNTQELDHHVMHAQNVL